MNTLTQVRDELATLLTKQGLSAKSYLPERPDPPVAVVSPGSPYLESGGSFGSFTAKFTVLLLVRTGTNEKSTEALDAMLARAVIAVSGSELKLAAVDQPALIKVNNADYLGVTMDVTWTGYLEVDD